MAEKQDTLDRFQGLPLASQIGGPLQAAQDAQTLLDQSTADFIQTVGTHSQTEQNGAAQKASFLAPPVISKVPIPDLAIDKVDVHFEREVAASAGEAAAAADQKNTLGALEEGAALPTPPDRPIIPDKHP